MSALGFWPVAVQPLGPVSCGTMLWRRAGAMHVTIVVKATLSLEPDLDMAVLEPEPVSLAEGDLCPFLGRADVLVTHAYAYANGPRPTPAVAVRLAVIRGTPLMDKRLLVYGPNPVPNEGGSLFTRAALVTPDPATPCGRVLDPRLPGSHAGLGPISRRGGMDDSSAPKTRPRRARDVLEIPEALPPDHYQMAERDQQTSYLEGDEWVVLDGMRPDLPRLSSRLPGARAAARVYAPSGAVAGGPTFEVAMRADRLRLDVEQRRCRLLWRGSFPVADEVSARALTLVGALLRAGQSVWSEPGRAISAPLALEPRTGSAGAPPPPSDGAAARRDASPLRSEARPKDEAGFEAPPWEIDACDTTRRLRRGAKKTAEANAPSEPAKPSEEVRPAPPRLLAGLVVEDSTDGAPETVRYDRPSESSPSGGAGSAPDAEIDAGPGTRRFVRNHADSAGMRGATGSEGQAGAAQAGSARRAGSDADEHWRLGKAADGAVSPQHAAEVRPGSTADAATRGLGVGDVSRLPGDNDFDTLDGRRTAVRPEGLGPRMQPADLPVTTVEELEQTLSGAVKLSVRDVELLEQLSRGAEDSSEKPGSR